MSNTKNKIDLFRYQNYRDFLKDWYKNAKASRGSFSFRAFSKRAGFKSTNFFKLVMDGDRNITNDSLPGFIKGLRLNKQEQDFFKNLVFFNQAKNHTQKDFYYKKLLQSRKYKKLKPLEKRQYEYCSQWYHAVIRELATSPEFDGSINWILNRIDPELSAQQVEKSLLLLERMNFITKTENGTYKQTTPLVSTGAEANSLVLMKYHNTILNLTKDKLQNVPASLRDISSLTLGVTEKDIPELKKLIQNFRKEILKFASTNKYPNNVVQLNIQMYPVTKIKTKDSI